MLAPEISKKNLLRILKLTFGLDVIWSHNLLHKNCIKTDYVAHTGTTFMDVAKNVIFWFHSSLNGVQ